MDGVKFWSSLQYRCLNGTILLKTQCFFKSLVLWRSLFLQAVMPSQSAAKYLWQIGTKRPRIFSKILKWVNGPTHERNERTIVGSYLALRLSGVDRAVLLLAFCSKSSKLANGSSMPPWSDDTTPTLLRFCILFGEAGESHLGGFKNTAGWFFFFPGSRDGNFNAHVLLNRENVEGPDDKSFLTGLHFVVSGLSE